MSRVSGSIGVNGATVPVAIGLRPDDIERRRWSDPPVMVPDPARTEAIIDTGAEMTIITPEIALLLRFGRPIRTIRLSTVAGGTAAQPVHPVSISLGKPGVSIRPIVLSVVVARLATARHGCLIGRDLLGLIDFHWAGPSQSWSIELAD